MNSAAEFDQFTDEYEVLLNRGLALAGESQMYFAHGRLAWLRSCLCALGESSQGISVLDFGCGTGSTVPLFETILGAKSVVGVDVSEASLAVARQKHDASRIQFRPIGPTMREICEADVAYCNGVFHHIVPQERANAIEFVRCNLRPGGLFAFWENNPWNPGTRLIMRRVAFDRDAIMLTARQAGKLLRAGGFEILRIDYLFIFPRLLRALRPLEPMLSHFPFGGQYQVLARRPC